MSTLPRLVLPTDPGPAASDTEPSASTPPAGWRSGLAPSANDGWWMLVWLLLAAMGLFAFATAAVASDAASASQAVPRPQLFKLEQHTAAFKIVSGSGSGDTVTLELQRTEGGWAMALDGLNTLHLSEADGGGVDVGRVELAGQGRVLTFDPPAIYLPARFEPGASFSRSGKVEITNAQSGETVTQGEYQQDVEPASRTTFELPLGRVEGFEQANNVRIETDWASVKLDLVSGFAAPNQEHVGLVRRDMKINITKAAFFGSTTERVLERTGDR